MTVAVVDVASIAQLSNFLSTAHAWAGSIENCPEIEEVNNSPIFVRNALSDIVEVL